ncbi:MAG: hypothetical protein GC151_13875 [Betaproteobacteria bacterium]|nr:hypothetical protein [Betaproteobacteria bacterium]
MGWRERVAGWLAPNASTSTHLREAATATVDPDEDQWRRLSGDLGRDLNSVTQDRMQAISAKLWEANNLANRIVELPIAYMLSEGVRLTSPDAEAQTALDAWWGDPINRMDERVPELLRGLSIFGELCLPAFVNELSGRMRFGYLDPALIATVVLDPENPGQPIGVVTKKDRKGIARRFRVILLGPDSDLFTSRTKEIRATFTDGDAFYFRVNNLPGGSRGRSDLLPQADWLDGYDNFLFGELDRAQFLRAFIWHVVMKGATQDQVDAYAKKLATPKPGTTKVTNDSIEWNPLTPSLQSADLSNLARLIRNHALGGATIPEHWFGGGGDVNRAVGAEMAEPTIKMFSMRQRDVKAILETMGRFVLWRKANAAGDQEVDWTKPEFQAEAVFPEMSPKDTTKYATALQQVVTAVGIAVDAGRMTEMTAVRLIATVAGRLGVEINAEDELQDALAEMSARRANDANFNTPPGDPSLDTRIDPASDPATGNPGTGGNGP